MCLVLVSVGAEFGLLAVERVVRLFLTLSLFGSDVELIEASVVVLKISCLSVTF